MILVNDNLSVTQSATAEKRRWKESLDRIAGLRDKLQELTDPSPEQVAEHRAEVLKITKELATLDERFQRGFDEVLALDGAGFESSHVNLPVFFARRKAIDEMVRGATGSDLAALEAKIDQGPSPCTQVLSGWSVDCQANVVHRSAEVKNVAAILEGRRLADETVVVATTTTTWDIAALARWPPGRGKSTTGLTTTRPAPRCWSKSHEPYPAASCRPHGGGSCSWLLPPRNAGCWGASSNAQPAIPLEKTVAMINLNMVGRLTDNRLTVYGTGTADEFDPLVERLNQHYGFEIEKEPGGYGPSDHATFYAKQIPVLHFSPGNHSDYHRPSDDADKLDLEGMRRSKRWSRRLCGRWLSRRRGRTTWRPRPRSRGGGDRPYFGSVPEFGKAVEGYALLSVTPNGPAERRAAGGRRDCAARASRIGGLDDFDGACGSSGAGDQVVVRVRRGDQELDLTVTLDPPK